MSHIVVEGRDRQGNPVLACRICGERMIATCDDCVRGFHQRHDHQRHDHQQDSHTGPQSGQNMGLGDVVAAGIKALFGIKPCAACKQRQAALNRAVPRVYRR